MNVRSGADGVELRLTQTKWAEVAVMRTECSSPVTVERIVFLGIVEMTRCRAAKVMTSSTVVWTMTTCSVAAGMTL